MPGQYNTIIMRASGSDSDDFREEDDEYKGESAQEKNFKAAGLDDKGSKVLSSDWKFKDDIPKTIEIMFILFSFYQSEITEIGNAHNCQAKISLNRIKIFCNSTEDEFSKCKGKITEFVDRIAYFAVEQQIKLKIFFSPFMNAKANDYGFKLSKFNSKIYCHSITLTEKQLREKMKELFASNILFSVSIKSSVSKQREIYNHYRAFIKKMMEYHSKQFKERKVVVELDVLETKINCIGSKERDLVAVKNIMKNLIQSTVILVVRFENIQGIQEAYQQLKGFIKQKCSFPVVLAKIQKKYFALISKENVIRKLLERQKVQELLKINQKSEVGMFLPRMYNFRERKLMIEEICTKKGYDFTALGSIYHFFRKMFIHEDEKEVEPKELLPLIFEILEAIKENKERFNVPAPWTKNVQPIMELEVTTGQYYSFGQFIQNQELSKLLKRDVLEEKLKMSKPALVNYNVFDGEESATIYWYEENSGNKLLIQPQQMKAQTEYFRGRVKQLGNESVYFYQAKVKPL